jgi:iron(III) transport system permease protein
MSAATADSAPRYTPRPRVLWSERLVARGGLVLLAISLLACLTAPLAAILVRSVQTREGAFAGLSNFAQYFALGSFANSIGTTLQFAVLTTLITVPLAFLFAYAIQRSCIPGKALWRNIAMIPILAPSLLAAISFIYLFGNQGAFKFVLGWFGLKTIYGMPGMVLAMSFSAFPHAVMILLAGLALSDARLYEAADSLGTSEFRKFMTITLPGARYGVISAAMVVFTMTVSEFGVPKVIGGNTSVLAIDVYKQVIGQQNFQIGAVVGLILLVPALVAFFIDYVVRGRQKALLSARSVPYSPAPSPLRDALLLAFVVLMSAVLLLIVGMAVFGSLVKVWPYNLSLTLNHYTYGFEEAGVDNAYGNSLRMAAWCAAIGAIATFAGAYGLEKTSRDKTRGFDWLRPLIHLQAMMPMAVPGMVLGIGYILFFNNPANPLTFLYGTMTILVLSTIAHFYSSSHLTAVTALKGLDNEFESVSASLKVPVWRTFARVTAPICLPAILDIAIYLFVNAMTTVSSVIFLYAPDTKLASVAAVNIEESGATAVAAALCIVIVITSAAFKALHVLADRFLLGRLQAWRRR